MRKYNLVVNPARGDNTISVADLEVGQLAEVAEEGSYEGHILVQTYDSVVSLTDPQKTWGTQTPYKPTFRVRVLKAGTKVLLTAY